MGGTACDKPGTGAAGRAWGQTMTLAPLPPASRSAPTRPKPTTRALPTWTARSKADRAASAPRAGGSQRWGHLARAQLPPLRFVALSVSGAVPGRDGDFAALQWGGKDGGGRTGCWEQRGLLRGVGSEPWSEPAALCPAARSRRGSTASSCTATSMRRQRSARR